MNRNSPKNARRSAKTTRRAIKKSAKSARGRLKKPAKSPRRPDGKSAVRPVRGIAVRATGVASKRSNMIPRTPSPPVQPLAAHEITLRAHKYRVGETVYYTSPTFGRAAASGSYTVVKLLPSEGDDYQYRIKRSGEAFERVVKESQLDRV